MVWPRPVPLTGDRTSSAERAAAPAGWAFPPEDAAALGRIIGARRDIRRFRPDPVDPDLLWGLLDAAHRGPSVGHSQPWRFVVVQDPDTRQRAAVLADRARLAQAAALDEVSGRHLLDLDLEGIREAPVGIVVCCDRRAPAEGVLGRATLADADLWSCACAIENLWLAARAEGLGVGWVTLFRPDDLIELVGAPDGVVTLGWLCVGWPDERPPAPGLERRGWSVRQPLEEVVLAERWPSDTAPVPPRSRLRPPEPAAVVSARDRADRLLAPPAALGVLDRVADRVLALGGRERAAAVTAGTLVLAAADHPVAGLGVSAYPDTVTRHVVEAALEGRSFGAVAARRAGLGVVVVDAGVRGEPVPGARSARPRDPRGDLVATDALSPADVRALVDAGTRLGSEVAGPAGHLVTLGEVGVGNTTVAAALAALLLELDPESVVGLGSGADSAIVTRKLRVVEAVTRRYSGGEDPWAALAAAGGPELAVLVGVCLGAAGSGAPIVLDGLATSVAALVAVRSEPAVSAHLVAGQRSRERGHGAVLGALGLEPLLDLRRRAGEGVGACLAAELLVGALEIRRLGATTG